MAKQEQGVEKQQLAQTEKAIEYVPFGATDKIKLSVTMIREFIAVPTRSGALPSARDCMRFLMLCRGKRANPFEGDCYLIGYDSQSGPSFSLVCGIELFLKRAEQSEDYDGNEYGIIVEKNDGEIDERKGTIIRKNENLIGGWARVYRKNRTNPVYKTASFDVYNTGKSRWTKDPCGMIAKVALSQALRETYTTALGGLYTQEEMEKVTETGTGIASIREPIQMPEVIEGKPEIEHKEHPQERQPGDDDDK